MDGDHKSGQLFSCLETHAFESCFTNYLYFKMSGRGNYYFQEILIDTMKQIA